MPSIPILLETADFVVVNKPPGISVNNEQDAGGLLSPLCQQLGIEKLWLVHRLDKVTSGVLLLARHAEAAAALSAQFAARQTRKYYLAVTDRKPAKKQGRVAGDMRKSRDGKWMLLKNTDNPAVTQFFSFSLEPGVRLVVLKPHTGKTHQLRVAMKSLGSPILGDQAYKGTPSDRTYLHAFALEFSYLNQEYRVISDLVEGEYLSHAQHLKLFEKTGPPWTLNWPVLPAGLTGRQYEERA